MFSCEYCGTFKITCFEEYLRTTASMGCYLNLINLEQSDFGATYLIKSLFQNENTEIISNIVTLRKNILQFSNK